MDKPLWMWTIFIGMIIVLLIINLNDQKVLSS